MQVIVEAFKKQGWNKPIEQYQRYLKQQKDGTRVVLVAYYKQQFAGYITIVKSTNEGPFKNDGYPELRDFNVLIEYQHLGIGRALMENAENYVRSFSPIVTLGVGLHKGYGRAMRLYIHRGYNFDGSGVWYQNKPLTPYENCCNNDELVLYLYKKL